MLKKNLQKFANICTNFCKLLQFLEHFILFYMCERLNVTKNHNDKASENSAISLAIHFFLLQLLVTMFPYLAPFLRYYVPLFYCTLTAYHCKNPSFDMAIKIHISIHV